MNVNLSSELKKKIEEKALVMNRRELVRFVMHEINCSFVDACVIVQNTIKDQGPQL